MAISRKVTMIAFFVASLAASGPQVLAGSTSGDGESKVVQGADGSILVVPASGKIPAGTVVTWTAQGVVWASKGARTLVEDPASGSASAEPVTVSESARASALTAPFTCSTYANNPVNYASANLMGAPATQVCSGAFGTQYVSARLEVKAAWTWGATSWSNSNQTAGSTTSVTHYWSCADGVTSTVRTRAQGHANGISSPTVLSSAEPTYTC